MEPGQTKGARLADRPRGVAVPSGTAPRARGSTIAAADRALLQRLRRKLDDVADEVGELQACLEPPAPPAPPPPPKPPDTYEGVPIRRLPAAPYSGRQAMHVGESARIRSGP